MKIRILRILIVSFVLSIFGAMALVPSARTDDVPSDPNQAAKLGAAKGKQAAQDEAAAAGEEEDNSKDEGGCCGGSGGSGGG